MSNKSVVLLTTGGTIAGLSGPEGYLAAVLPGEELLAGLPPLPFAVEVGQVMSLDSRDMTPELMLSLAHTVMDCLREPRVKGVVVTHGTDTLEETAFFLSQLLPALKPVVFSAAMRPADSLSPDGPMNLYQALLLAGSGESLPGIMAVLNDVVYCGASLRKTAPSQLNAFSGQVLGQMEQNRARFLERPRPANSRFDLDSIKQLPQVPLLYAYAGMPAGVLQCLLQAGCSGLVLAAVGNGSVPRELYPTLLAARDKGVIIVLASRIGRGYVNAHDDNFISAGWFSPLRARMLLQLGLSAGLDEAGLGRLFMNDC